MNELCTVWFAAGGMRGGLIFFVLHSVRMLWLSLGDVSGWRSEWAVHSVICCRWYESWNEFSLFFSQCAHGFVKVWWCQWMCWMSRAQCDLLLVAWESDWVFWVFYNTVGLVLLRFGDASGCAEWAVHSVIWCWWCEFWRWREIRFFCVPAVVAWVLGRWRELRPPPSNITMVHCDQSSPVWVPTRWPPTICSDISPR